jgi:(2Fe-2S) ferredoxin
MKPAPEVAAALEKIKFAQAQKHLFLCPGPNCCESADGLKVWEHLKKRVKEGDLKIMRTKTECFRVCTGGPWLVVYPDGIWYGAMTPERCDRILDEHVGQRKPVTEWIVAQNDL